MKPETVLFLQSLLITLQMANAGLATLQGLHPLVPMLSAAVVGGFQFYTQHIGNQIQPTK